MVNLPFKSPQMAVNVKKKKDKRDRILTAAADVFNRFGFERSTLEDIGKRCQLNKSSLYYYFSSKEEIYAQVILKETAKFISDLQATTLTFSGISDRLVFYLTERIRRYDEVINLTQISLESRQKLEPIFLELSEVIREKEITFILSLFEQAAENGELPRFEASELAESFYIISEALKKDWLEKDELFIEGRYDYNAVETRMTAITVLILNGLQR